jgi:hypothetical protein
MGLASLRRHRREREAAISAKEQANAAAALQVIAADIASKTPVISSEELRASLPTLIEEPRKTLSRKPV